MSKEPKVYLTKGALLVYRGLVLGTCCVFLWLQQHFVTSREFVQHKGEEKLKWKHHDDVRDETLDRLLKDNSRIEAKLDRIETILLNRRDRAEIQGPMQPMGAIKQ